MQPMSTVSLAILALIAAASIAWYVWSQSQRSRLPTVGAGRGLVGGVIAGINSFKCMHEWIGEGYRAALPAFRVRWGHRWMTLVTTPEALQELHSAPGDVLSAREAVIEELSLDHTLGPWWRGESAIHHTLVRSHLTKSLDRLFPAALDEMQHGFDDEIGSMVGNDWVTVSAKSVMTRIICRTSNRLFVGAPLCRDEEYVRLNVDFTRDVVTSAAMLMWPWPRCVKRFIGTWLSPIQRAISINTRLVKPHIEEREKLKAAGDWEERRDDMLQWILDSSDENAKQTPQIVARLLNLNFSSIYTTATVFIFTLHRLASDERYIEILRADITAALMRDGWNKAALDQLPRLDSFLRECARMHSLSAVSLLRKATRDFKFVDGVVIPKDTMVAAPSRAIHTDARADPTAQDFDGFRFVGQRYPNGVPKTMTATGVDYMAFGHGKHSCPGRFWAETEIKMMIAHLLVHFDIRLEGSATVLSDEWFCHGATPNKRTQIQLRRRAIDEDTLS